MESPTPRFGLGNAADVSIEEHARQSQGAGDFNLPCD
jgi:hypothetical protein